jgi:uncharacterized protein YkvS
MHRHYVKYEGKYCRIEWNGGELTGIVEKVEGDKIIMDFGYGISFERIIRIEETTPPDKKGRHER